MSETTLKIEGMTCMHCQMRVEKALKAVPGTVNVRVDLAQKQAVVSGQADRDSLTKAVQTAGYRVAD